MAGGVGNLELQANFIKSLMNVKKVNNYYEGKKTA